MTEKMNGQPIYEKQKTEPKYIVRRALAGIALVGVAATLNHTFNEFSHRSDKQLEVEQQPSLEDQLFDAIENYDEKYPQVKYEIPQDGTVSQQMEVAAKALHESNEDFTYPDNHQQLALVNSELVAGDIKYMTGRGVRPGDSVTTWYDLDLKSFVSAATDALPHENQ